MRKNKRAVFLDRDSTLNQDSGYTHRVEDFVLLHNVVPGLQLLRRLGFLLIVTTNQAGIGRGFFTEAQMHAFHARLHDELAKHEIELDAIYFCPFHPTAGQGEYLLDSPLRKPQPGMILQAARDFNLHLPSCYAIGDRMSDVRAGQAAGCRTILVTGDEQVDDEQERGEPGPDFIAQDLWEAARWIQSREAKPEETE